LRKSCSESAVAAASSPLSYVGPGARSLNQTIQANGLNVKWIVGGHGGVISYADFTAALAAAPAS